MTIQRVHFVTTEQVVLQFDRPEAFSLRTDKKWPWLQRLCFAVLRRLGAFDVGQRIEYKRHTIDAGTFMERLFQQQGNIERLFHRHPTKVLIGAEDYAEIMREDVAFQQFEFRAAYNVGWTVCGLTVEVIPWMRGVLVMP